MSDAAPPPISLHAPTPPSWAERAAAHLPELLADHAVCELQAAVSALSLVGQYPEIQALVDRLSALAAEELRHFRRVTREARRFGVSLATRRRNPYAAALRAACRSGKEPDRGLDLLLVSALIEARSHERFEALVPFLPDGRLKRLYRELADAEARHGPAFLSLAVAHAGESTTAKRLAELIQVEARAITSGPVSPVAVHGRA